ncbi:MULTISPECIES: Bug family tripartite tricarboxylate transporter substrate binding protein [Pacificibacter]|uniref:Bug family tripartite tricarboxylate transporter substrate binding protein n=1 Tax=Pacificibacter TaxID=1042323 RepID=UPI001C0A1C3C|nr:MULTISPECIES: tripartite tricarboxylate transporter substrate binding protein [Pacificibacter]MBU2936750.1 tripartite tricarboxylate transporter substrate binding protein [Pacificibacter marinus]MDO6617361.1 tripartite tricarboxylate transporter substrate binding protein [Pacificibacter sp. 1_MG-2023]
MMRTIFNHVAVGVLAATMGVSTAQAQDFPEKAITLIIPFGAGGSHDVNSRVVTSLISEYLGQPMIVKLMPGASGQTATAEAANARPDGYTLLFTHNIYDQLQKYTTQLPYDPLEDFVTVAQLNTVATCIVANSDGDFKTFDDLIEFAQDNPGEIEWAHSGQWGSGMIHAAEIMSRYDVRFNLTPYPGGGPALQAVLAGDADFTTVSPSVIQGLGSRIVTLACGEESDAIADDIPIYGTDLPLLEGVGVMHRIVMAPSDIAEDRLALLRQAFVDLQENDTFKSLMSRIGETESFVDGATYESRRAEQSQTFKELVIKLTQN